MVAGLSDRRFEGVVASFFSEKGFGFIRCEELRASRFPDKDIFVHKHQMADFGQGDFVSFIVSLSSQGKPQALELGPSGWNGPANAEANGSTALAQTAGQGFLQLEAGLSPAPPPPPASSVGSLVGAVAGGGAPQALTAPGEDFSQEVEVPGHLLEDLRGAGGQGLSEILQRAGGSVSIQFQAPATEAQRASKLVIAVFRGQAVDASIASMLVQDRISELLLCS